MPLSDAITASATALDAQRARIEVAVSNIANAESTRGPDGQPYRRRDVVLRAEPIEPFSDSLGRAEAIGVTVNEIVEDQSPFRRRYEPSPAGAALFDDRIGIYRDLHGLLADPVARLNASSQHHLHL